MGFNVERSLPTVLPLCRLEKNVLQTYRISDPARSWTYFGHLRTFPLFRYLLSTLVSEVCENTRSRPTNRLRASPYISAVTISFLATFSREVRTNPISPAVLTSGLFVIFRRSAKALHLARPTCVGHLRTTFHSLRVSSPDFSRMLVADR